MQLRGPQIPNPHALRGANHTDHLRATAVLAETYSRTLTMANLGALSTGRLSLFGIYVPINTVVTNLNFVSATTPLSAGTNQVFGFYSSALAKFGVSADDGSTAWAANIVKTLPVSRSVTDATITSGAATVTSATAAFTASDVGKKVTFMGAGAAAVPLGTSAAAVTISSVTNATTAVLDTNASTTVASGGTLYIATPYTTVAEGFHYAGIWVTAGTVPTLSGLGGQSPLHALTPITAGTSTTGLTAGTGAPDPAAALTAQSSFAYAYIT